MSKIESIMILGKPFQVKCTEDEAEALQQTALYLDKKMCEIRDSGKVMGSDRITLLAALNICHDLLALQKEAEQYDGYTQRLHALHNKIDNIFTEHENTAETADA